MKKRISDFLLDVSKYVFAGLLIAPLINSTFACNDAYWYALTVALIALIVGLFLSKQKKGAVNKNNNNRNKNYRKNNNNRNNTATNRA
ncbi:hypothetical protein RCZ04_18420 [Capnocytophaga sp. HP1101]